MPMEQRPPSPSDSSGGRSGRRRNPASVTPTPPTPAGEPQAAFAHASEAELARILDFYAVRWEYEPHTFPILWNLDGVVVESFSPDFWLPDLDLYLELTTLKQSLVRKKNRKLRRLRELYPDVRVKLFYGRDFRALMLKYGKLALVAELSGAPGQAVVVRPGEALVAEPQPEELAMLAGAIGGVALEAGVELLDGEVEPAAVAKAEPAAVANVESGPGGAASSPAARRRRRGRRAGTSVAKRPPRSR